MSIKTGNKTIAGDGSIPGVLIDNSLGHIFQSLDLTIHRGTQRCNGVIFDVSEKLKEKFVEFDKSGGMETFKSSPENSRGIPYISFEEYENLLEQNIDTKGNKSCGFFGYDKDSGQARTPTIAEGTVLAQAVMNGNLMQWLRDAVPNITGNDQGGINHKDDPDQATGAFSMNTYKNTISSIGSGSNYGLRNSFFDASKSNEVYGRDNEDELRPKQIRYPFLVVVDTIHSTSNTVDRLITENSYAPYLFFHSVSNYIIKDLSMINASKFEWLDGKIYSVAYQELLKEYNSLDSIEKTLTVQGISVEYKLTPKKYRITLSDQEDKITELYDTLHSADYFILDTNNKRFKLPRKNYRKLIHNYKQGFEYYNVYSDGWCEQGGQMALGTTGVDLRIAMIDENYFVGITSTSYSYTAGVTDSVRVRTSTHLTLSRSYNGSNNFAAGTIVDYFLEGYCNTELLDLPFEYEYYYLGRFDKSFEDNSLTQAVFYLQEEIQSLKSRLGGGRVITLLASKDATDDDPTWYKIWSNGDLEQGGIATISQIPQPISFMYQFKDTNYFLNPVGFDFLGITSQGYTSSQIGFICELYGTKTVSEFKATGIAINQSGTMSITSLISGAKINWEAKGKIDKSSYTELEFTE